MLAFLYVKMDSKEICEEISFPSFFKKMLMSAFLFRLGNSRKYPYLYHGRLFGFPKGRGGLRLWNSEGMGRYLRLEIRRHGGGSKGGISGEESVQ